MLSIMESSSPAYAHTCKSQALIFAKVCWYDPAQTAPVPLRDLSGRKTGLNSHYSARLWSLSIILALTVRWINWCIWQGQLLPYVVLTAGLDIRNLSASPSREWWEGRLSESGEDISECSPHSQQLQIVLLNRITDIFTWASRHMSDVHRTTTYPEWGW